MSYEKPPAPWVSRPTLIPVVLNGIAGVIFLVFGVIAVLDGRHWVWPLICAVMIGLIVATTWPMYKRWRDRDQTPLTR